MDPPANGDDFMDEDMELQLALALSLQETTAADIGAPPAATGAATAGAAPPAAAPAAPPAAAPAPAQGPAPGWQMQLGDLAALLSQGLQAALPPAAAPAPLPAAAPTAAAPAAPPAAPPNMDALAAQLQQFLAGMGPMFAAPHQQQPHAVQQAQAQQRVAAGTRAASARAAAPPPVLPMPGWAARLQRWWAEGRASAAFHGSSVTLGGQAALAAVCGHLGEALQVKVVGDMASIEAGSLFLKASPAPGGGLLLTADTLRSLINSALLKRSSGPLGTKDRLQALHRAHDALPAPAAPPAPPADGGAAGGDGGVAAALDLAAGTLCREAAALLRDDGPDLYSDTGTATAAWVEALAGGPATMCEAFLDALLDTAAAPTAAASSASSAAAPAAAAPPTACPGPWPRLLRDTLRGAFGPVGRSPADAHALGRPLLVLDRATCTTRLQQCMAACLLEDVAAAARARPAEAPLVLERTSVLTPLVGISPMPSNRDALVSWKAASAARQAFLESRGYPKNQSAGASTRTVLEAAMARVQDGVGQLMLRLSKTKDGGLTREALMSWVAAVGRLNGVRAAFGETHEMRTQQDTLDFLAGGSDGFLLNVTGGLLRLAQPFVAGWLELYRKGVDPAAAAAAAAAAGTPAPRFSDLFDKHLRPEYYARQRHRLGDLSAVFNATGSRGAGGFSADDEDGPAPPPPLLLQGDSPDGGPSFMADVFFLTQLLMHVGPMQTIARHRAMMHRFQTRYRQEMGGGGGGEEEDDEGAGPEALAGRGRDPWANPLALEMSLYNDCTVSHLHEPLFADNLTAFAVLELDWVAWLVRGGAGDPAAALRLVPEHAPGDALDWLTALLYAGRADMVASKPIAVIMRALVTMLNAGDVVRGAMLQNRVVNLLLAMLASQIHNVQSREARGTALAPDRMSPGERALVGAVLGAPATQRDLIPALLRAHVNAELVVGLDVDKDAYDKYGMRTHIDNILEELIKDGVLRRRLTDLAAGRGGEADRELFADYASGIVNTVMHFFKDGLDRLADIYAIERSKADAAAWAALPAEERKRKEDFYRGQQRSAKGFLRMGVLNLKWLNNLTADPAIAAAFLHEPLRGKAAFLVVSCLEMLLGDACKKLQVAKPEQYDFDLPVLVGAVLGLLLQLAAQHPAFVEAVVAEPDYSEEIMSRALDHTRATYAALQETRLAAFLARAAELRGAGEAAAVPPASPTAERPPLKRPKSNDAGAAAEPMDTAQPASAAAQEPSAAPLACERVSLPGPALEGGELEAAYAAELGPLAFAEYDSGVPGGYFKEMARLADQDCGASKAKMRRLAKEVSDMQPGGRLALPVMAAAAVFLRQDAARADKLRAVLTGPQGTPYEGGLFVFDIFLPSGYPALPPVMMVYNTGGGKARYNPNLYADGKVCLSLLGTYNSGAASEKWNPDLSSIYQILVSVQAQILVDDPMTNEPLSETLAGTAEGSAKTAEYNARLQLLVMRHAMQDVLSHPPPGTEDLVASHFRLLRARLAATFGRWVRAAPTAELRARLDEQAARVLGLMAGL